MRLNKILILILLITTQSVLASKKVYLLIWGSTQTSSGAGHSAIGFQDSSDIHYYSNYPKSSGGNLDTIVFNFDQLIKIDSSLGIQTESPYLVLEFSVTNKEFEKMKKVSKRKSKKRWNLFVLNCSDFVKVSFKETKYDMGYSFLISTPYELVKDINDNNIDLLEKKKIKIKKGKMVLYLKKEPKAVPYTIKKFFKIKK
jgi:hypothetical protein